MNTRRVMIGLSLCGCLMSAGCREDRDPPKAYEGVMRDGSTALASMPGPMLDTRVAEGSAQFPEFRPPSSGSSDHEGGAGGSESEAIAEIRSLIDEYNGIVDRGEYDDLAEYYIEAQRESATSLIAVSKDGLAKLNELGEALNGALPDDEDRITSVLETLNGSSSLKLTVSSLEASGDELVTGALPAVPGIPSTIHFRLMEYDGETNWYIDFPLLAMWDAMKPLMEAQLASWDQSVAAVKADASAAEAMLTGLEAAAEMVKTMSGG